MKIKRLLLHPLFLFAVALFLLPYVLVYTGSYVNLGTQIIIWALLAMGFNFLYGHTGDLSFGHGMFFAIAGYVTGNVVLHWQGNPLLAGGLGMLAVLAWAWLVGKLVVSRTRGIYFAMTTLAFGQVIFFLAYTLTKVTGGENGLSGIPKPNLTAIGVDLRDPPTFYYITAVLVWLAAALLWRIAHSPFGKVCKAIRYNRQRPEFLGYDVGRYRLWAFVISAAFAGFAGVLSAYHLGYVDPFATNWTGSGDIVLMTVLGGLEDFFGPALGALTFKFLQDWLSSLTIFDGFMKKYWFLPLGLVFVGFVVFAPRGIYGILSDLGARFRGRRKAPPAVPAAAEEPAVKEGAL